MIISFAVPGEPKGKARPRTVQIAGHASSKMYLIEDASTLALAFTSFHIPYRFIRIMLNIVSNRPSSFLFDIVSP